MRSVAANISAFESEIADLEIKLKTALRQLPNKKELEVLLTDISNLGKTAGVEIKSFKRNDEVVHDFYAEVPIQIELEGEFHDIAQFFDLMSKLPRIVNMGALTIKVASENEEATVLVRDGDGDDLPVRGQGQCVGPWFRRAAPNVRVEGRREIQSDIDVDRAPGSGEL